jgi:hypothetical protein
MSAGSDSDDSDFTARSSDKPFHIVRVACKDHGLLAEGCRNHDSINDIRSSGDAEQPPCVVRFALTKSNNHATGQEAPELRLLRGPAYLGDHRRRNQWNNAKFQTGFVFSPRPTLVPIGGHENRGIVDDRVQCRTPDCPRHFSPARRGGVWSLYDCMGRHLVWGLAFSLPPGFARRSPARQGGVFGAAPGRESELRSSLLR